VPTAIVYGTVREAATNRYVAEEVQAHFRERAQREMAIYKDFAAPESVLAHDDIIFIGRPETNSALALWSGKIGLDYQGAVFKVDGQTYASEGSALVYAAKNPLDASRMVVVYAGNSPLETDRASQALQHPNNSFAGTHWESNAVAVVLKDGEREGSSD
jgi:hypothetical protein